MPTVLHIDAEGNAELRDYSPVAWSNIQRRGTLVPSSPTLASTCPVCGAHMTKGRHLANCKNNPDRA